jgi:transcriptional regulator
MQNLYSLLSLHCLDFALLSKHCKDRIRKELILKSDTYHHGNLKEELVEKGLAYIDQYGLEALSMRKLADSTGVSPAAPYAHFKNKEAFLSEVRNYVNHRFYSTLVKATEDCSDHSRILFNLGKSYVLFFYENPLYYRFLFSIENIDIENYSPFVLFKNTAEKVWKEESENRDGTSVLHSKVIALWSLVHGLSSIVNMKGAVDTDHLEAEVEQILDSITV